MNVSWLLKVTVLESAKSGFLLTSKVPQVPKTSQIIARTLKNLGTFETEVKVKVAYILCN